MVSSSEAISSSESETITMKKVYSIIALALITLASCVGPRGDAKPTEASFAAGGPDAPIHGWSESN